MGQASGPRAGAVRQLRGQEQSTMRMDSSLAAHGVRPMLVVILICLFAGGARAQLVATRPCCHVKQPILVELKAPDAASSTSDAPGDQPLLGVELISPATGEVLESRQARPGQLDLGVLFSRLWSTDAPTTLYAQAVRGGKRIGPALVLSPMLTPKHAARVDRDGTPRIVQPSSKPVFSGYWLHIDQRIELATAKGTIVFTLHPDAAPNGVRNFRELVSQGFYDGVPIHRIASISGRARPDILQFGDPTGTGQGGPGFHIDFEPSPLRHRFGTMSYARTSDPNSAGSQVFVCLGGGESGGEAGATGGPGGANGGAGAGSGVAAQLDGRYSVFASLVTGAEVLASLAKSAVDAEGRPREPLKIESAKLVDAPPFGEGPKPEGDPYEKPPQR